MTLTRSENMRRIRSKGMSPEMTVRKTVHKMGFRFRLHAKQLIGCPDLVFHSRKKIIFVHGCFWHQHEKCIDGRIPKTRTDYWIPKLKRNCERSAQVIKTLKELGWNVLVVWECETKDADDLEMRLRGFIMGSESE